MKLLPMLAAGSFQHHATRRQPSMKSSTSPIINHFHSIRGWIVFPESRRPGRLLLLVAAAVLVAATHFLFGSFPAYAQSPDGAISGLTLASDEAQTLTITWDAASPMPKHYEVYWAYKGGDGGAGAVGTWSGRATTTDTSYTATELFENSVYRVGVRARYEESWGPWSDEEELKVLWSYVSPFFVFHQVQDLTNSNGIISGSVQTNYVPRDDDPSTLDLAVRVDVVDIAGKSWDYCEQDGMGMFQNRYIIDDLLEVFEFQYGSRTGTGDCISGYYHIVYVVKEGAELERVGTAPFRVHGGAVALVGRHLFGMPTITGTTSTGEMLTADVSGITIDNPPGESGGTEDLSYQWISSDGDTETDIAGATEATYTLADSDGGKLVKVKVFRDIAAAEDVPGFPTAARRDEAYSFPVLIDGVATSDATNQMASGAPTISGTAQVGQMLTASTSGISDSDGLTNATFTYQWLTSRDAEIDGATSSTYTLVEADEGKTIKVRVSLTDDAGNEETLTSQPTSAVAARPNNAATGAPTISGTAQVGQMLTASTSGISDSDGLTNATFAYQWLSSRDAEIDGATSSTYTLVEADEGKTIKVRVSLTDDAGNEETLTSQPTSAVAARPNNAATGAPTISGTVQVGQMLTASTSGISDSDGLTNATFTYQWLSSRDAEIDGATSSTYTMVEADEGKTIKVRVSLTDDRGNEETLTSAVTVAVAAAPSPLTVSVESAPTSHNGSDSFRIRIAFSETPESGFSYTTMRDHAFTVTGGDVTGARRLVSGKNLRWEITVQPSGNADVTVELPATTNCAAQGAICTDNDDKLSNSLNLTVSGPEATPPPAVVVSALTASVESTPTSHNGSNSFRIRIALSEAPKSSFSYTTMRDHAFTVTGGDVTGARRLVSGKNLRWEITVQPSGNADVTVLLPATTNCAAQGAICTGNDDKLSNSLNLIVSGPN